MGWWNRRNRQARMIIPYTRFKQLFTGREYSRYYDHEPEQYAVRLLEASVMHKVHPHREERARGYTCSGLTMICSGLPRPPTVV